MCVVWSGVKCVLCYDRYPMPQQKRLLVTSGDGFLSVYDLRMNKNGGLYALSQNMDDEQLSLAVVHQGSLSLSLSLSRSPSLSQNTKDLFFCLTIHKLMFISSGPTGRWVDPTD